MTQGLKALRVYTAPTGRRYLDVADLATISGLTASALDFKFRPEGWASPRDFRFEHGRLWFAVVSLQQLFDTLTRAGESDAALKLRERLLPWIEAATIEAGTPVFTNGVVEPAAPVSGADARARWEAANEQ